MWAGNTKAMRSALTKRGHGSTMSYGLNNIEYCKYKQVARRLVEKGIPMAREEFACRGSFAMMHKGKPDAADLKAAADFAKGIVAKG